MIPLALYNSSLKKTKKLLTEYRLCKYFPLRPFPTPSSFFSLSHERDYLKVYQTIVDNVLYDGVFFDDSIIQFDRFISSDHQSLRYAFYQHPYDVLDYESYLTENGFSFDEVGDTFISFYDQEVSESKINSSCVMVRYDYDESLYQEGVHPVSHIHIGNANEIRLPSSLALTPLQFVLFLIKQIYYPKWKSLLVDQSFSNMLQSAKTNCTRINPSFFQGKDLFELYLT